MKENKRLILVTLFVALFFTLTVYTGIASAINPTQINPSSLIRYYPFNETSGTTADSFGNYPVNIASVDSQVWHTGLIQGTRWVYRGLK